MDDNVISYIIFFIVLIIAFAWVPQWRLSRSIPKIISTFRKNGALDAANARTLDELGLRYTVTTPSLLGGSDPTYTAMQTLKDAGVVQTTREGRWFLSESQLAASKWKQKARAAGDKKLPGER